MGNTEETETMIFASLITLIITSITDAVIMDNDDSGALSYSYDVVTNVPYRFDEV